MIASGPTRRSALRSGARGLAASAGCAAIGWLVGFPVPGLAASLAGAIGRSVDPLEFAAGARIVFAALALAALLAAVFGLPRGALWRRLAAVLAGLSLGSGHGAAFLASGI